MNGSVENDRTQLARILATSLETLEIMDGHSRHTYEGNRALQLAAQKLVQYIGEAASHLSRDFRSQRPDIPWPEIIGMRHRLVHDFYAVDLTIVWDTATVGVPELVSDLERILADDRA